MQSINMSDQAVLDPNLPPKFVCRVCNFSCSSIQNFRIHLQNFKSHMPTADRMADENSQNPTTDNPSSALQTTLKMQNPTMVNPMSLLQTIAKMQNINKPNQDTSLQGVSNPNAKPKFSCKDCSFTCSSLQNYRIHLQTVHSKKDEKTQNMSAFKKAGKLPAKAQPGNAAARTEPEAIPGSSGRNIATLKDYMSRADREPLIGLEYVVEYLFKSKSNEIETKYFCELCECDTDLDPMVEHLAGFGHRKLYLAKEYPYVLKAQNSIKEDHSRFIRRMALEIEREEGTKMYMIDPSIWMETMMTLRTADKKMRKKTRWDDDRNDQTRMKKALTFLGTFEIESEIEATTVARLCEKLTANLKLYNTKSKEEALFPARVARAQDVAMALVKNAARLQNPTQKKLKPLMPPNFIKKLPTLPENASLNTKFGMQSSFPGANFQNMNAQQNMPKASPYPQARPFVPSNERQPMQGPSNQKAKNTQSDDPFLKNISQEDTQFFKKLMTLLDALPQNSSLADRSQMNSKLQMLKSMLANQKSAEHEQANQKLMTQIASMVQDTVSAQNATLNQQLMMLMTSQKSTAMVMQSTSGLVPGIQSSGNMQMDMNSLMPFNQNFGSQAYGQMEGTAMDQNPYQVPQAVMQNYPSTSQNYDNFRYGNSAEENYFSQSGPYISHEDSIANTPTTGQNEQKLIPYTDVGYEPSVYDKKWDNSYVNPRQQVPETNYVDRAEIQAPYTRVRLSPSSPQNRYDDYDDIARREIEREDMSYQHSFRSYDHSDWDDQEDDMRYMKRARLDLDSRSDRSESYYNQSLESLGINTADLPEMLLKKIKGKDLFTASAIIGEYSERR